ncbi:MAG: DUF6514 family protein [Oscillospiraceae bacterium]|jgi:hypothetical protein|nr:DUF6514 family protein [Oscillospiraceae bacterium]
MLRPKALQTSIQYAVVMTKGHNPDVGTYDTYGLIAMFNGKPVRFAPDVSVNRRKVETLAIKFNRIQLSPVHLLDVLEDLL